MNIYGQIIVIILCFSISFLYIRGFLYGIKRYRLNNSAYKKRKVGENFKEWLCYSRFRKEIPKILLLLYFFVLLVHPVCISVCVVLYATQQPNGVGEIAVRVLACVDAIWIVIIAILFWSPGPGWKYEHWIPKRRGEKRGKK